MTLFSLEPLLWSLPSLESCTPTQSKPRVKWVVLEVFFKVSFFLFFHQNKDGTFFFHQMNVTFKRYLRSEILIEWSNFFFLFVVGKFPFCFRGFESALIVPMSIMSIKLEPLFFRSIQCGYFRYRIEVYIRNTLSLFSTKINPSVVKYPL